jgi:fructose/tagatose bisphosphate aldolase
MRSTAAATPFGDAVRVSGETITIADERALQSPAMDALVRDAVFGGTVEREHARWLIWELAQAVGARPASIHELYRARGRGETKGFTVPAINVRGAAYDTARAIFRTAVKMNAGAFILEIARSEIAYTEQRPAEYVAVMLAAAMREGFRGPVFIQGDHFQVNAKKFAADAAGEVNSVKQLAAEAITAGFLNIDVDTSTLVNIDLKTLDEQQRLNYETAADIAAYVRSLEPAGVAISLGAEIGEVGTQNSTVAEERAFMDGYLRTMQARGHGALAPLSKISVQTGTSHGGIVLPDGTIKDVKLDLKALEELSKVARDEYGMAGAVQHGASTLPDTAFNHFPRIETAEIHLATNFQNILYDHLPTALRARIYRWLDENAKEERKPTDTDDQFYYKTRKKALGPFKAELWELPDETRTELAKTYDRTFGFLFEHVKVGGPAAIVAKTVTPPRMHHSVPAGAIAPDDPDAGE